MNCPVVSDVSFSSDDKLFHADGPAVDCIVIDLKLHLQSTDYGNFLANEASPLAVATIDDKLKEKLVIEFQHMRNHALPPLSTFLDYIT